MKTGDAVLAWGSGRGERGRWIRPPGGSRGAVMPNLDREVLAERVAVG